MQKKKIMFFIYRMGGGGAARTMLNIINYLDRDKFEPILVTLDFTYDYEEYVKEDVTFIKLNTKRLRKAIVPLAKLVRQTRPDILFSTVSTYNVIAILAKLLSGTKTKLIVREAALLGGQPKENTKLKWIGKLYRFSLIVVSLSEGVKDNLIKRYGVNPEKIRVIYNPIDLDHIQRDMKSKPTLPFNENQQTIVTAGRLVKEKDQLSLLRAFVKVNEKIPCELMILGEGELESQLQQEASKLQIEDRVHFIGFQQNPYAYFHHADLFALTSTSEGFGHVLVEALATGTPVVSTRCKPGAEEVLENGKYGALAEVGDVDGIAEQIFNTLTLSKEEKQAIIKKGQYRAEQFAANKIVRQYEAVFMETIEK